MTERWGGGDRLDAWSLRGEITVRSDWQAQQPARPSAGPAAPVVFQE